MHDMVRPVLGRTEAAHIGDDDSVAIVAKRGCDGGIGMVIGKAVQQPG